MNDIWNFGDKYEMDLQDKFALRKVLIIGVIAVEKCIKLGLGKELDEEFQEAMKCEK